MTERLPPAQEGVGDAGRRGAGADEGMGRPFVRGRGGHAGRPGSRAGVLGGAGPVRSAECCRGRRAQHDGRARDARQRACAQLRWTAERWWRCPASALTGPVAARTRTRQAGHSNSLSRRVGPDRTAASSPPSPPVHLRMASVGPSVLHIVHSGTRSGAGRHRKHARPPHANGSDDHAVGERLAGHVRHVACPFAGHRGSAADTARVRVPRPASPRWARRHVTEPAVAACDDHRGLESVHRDRAE